jgi:hypothetical protein
LPCICHVSFVFSKTTLIHNVYENIRPMFVLSNSLGMQKKTDDCKRVFYTLQFFLTSLFLAANSRNAFRYLMVYLTVKLGWNYVMIILRYNIYKTVFSTYFTLFIRRTVTLLLQCTNNQMHFMKLNCSRRAFGCTL